MPADQYPLDSPMKKSEEYSMRMQFEHGLINNRITWLLVSQGLLFSAYASALEKNESATFHMVVAQVGIAISVLAVIAITASLLAKYFTWRDLQKVHAFAAEPFWVRTPITALAAGAELAISVVFMFAWCVLCHDVCR